MRSAAPPCDDAAARGGSGRRVRPWGGPPQQVALAVVAAQFAQGISLRLGLDAFADGFDAQRARQRQHALNQRARTLHFRTMQAGDEALVDLQRADREAMQVGQRGEAGAEIIQLYLDAALAQALQDAQRVRAIVQQCDLGDLQPQSLRIGAVCIQQAEQAAAELRRAEMTR